MNLSKNGGVWPKHKRDGVLVELCPYFYDSKLGMGNVTLLGTLYLVVCSGLPAVGGRKSQVAGKIKVTPEDARRCARALRKQGYNASQMRKLAILLLLAWSMGVYAQLNVVVRNLTIEGAEAVPAQERQQIVRDVRSHNYRSDKLEVIGELVRLAFQDRGYFFVEVDDPRITEAGSYAPRQKVDVLVSVRPGQKYQLKEISFSGNRVFSDEQLRSTFPIADGDVFSRSAIGKGLEELQKSYGSRGYLNFTSVPSTEPDVLNRHIALHVDCDEGRQFRFGELILDGIEPYAGAGKQVLADWKHYRGKVFDAREFELFLVRHEKIFGTDPRTESRDPHDGSMNVVLHFDESVASN
jgi:hypothetical protein